LSFLRHMIPPRSHPVLFRSAPRNQLLLCEASYYEASSYRRVSPTPHQSAPRSGQISFVPRGLFHLFQNRKGLGTRFYFINQKVNPVCSNVPMFQESMNRLGRGRGDTQRHFISYLMKSPQNFITGIIFILKTLEHWNKTPLYLYLYI